MKLKTPIKSLGFKILKFLELKGTSKKITLPKATFIILTLFINCSIAKATTYYVDNAGNNINSGTSPDNAWQTLEKVNSYKFSPGDSILFKRGGIWRETLNISSSGSNGNNIVYSSYGSGGKPCISGADVFTSWVQDGSYYYTSISAIPKFVFDNQVALSVATSKGSLTSGLFYFDATNSRVYINYNPVGHVMEVSQRDNDISVNNKNYITIDGLQLQGGNYAGIKGQGSININSCAIRYNCSFGIFLHSNFLPSIISNNKVDHISGHGIEVYDSHFDIYGNTVDSIGIFHDAVKPINTDPAGINLSMTDSSDVHDNTISWVLSGGDNQNHGIYIADNSTNINVSNNTVHDNWYGDGIKFATNGNIYGNISYNNGVAGIGVHNNTHYAMNVNIHNNLCYNNTLGGINEYGMIQPVNLNIYNNTLYKNGYLRGQIYIGDNATSVIIKNNIIYSSNNSVGLNVHGPQSNLVMSNNLYFNDSTSYPYVVRFGGGYEAFSAWQGLGYDANSLNTDPLISNSDFHISSTFSPAILSGVDIYSGNPIDIGAYPYNSSSKSNAGPDKTITLPIDSTTLKGSAGDKDVTISNSQWTKIYGPSSYNIVTPSSLITDVTGLTEGVYQFELKVTGNNDDTTRDTVTITVNPLENIPPQADAGPDKSITLPANTTILPGSATDSDGTISSYLWTKISGPSAGMVNNANSASAFVNNLSEGVYQFELKVTDDKGGVGKDTTQITVNSAANISPTANAGADRTIELPTNSVSLSGTGTDSDGSISSYFWSKISGPSSYSISGSSSAFATVSGLEQGVYQFELKVMDDKGADGKDTVQITVNAAPNMPPTANAGVDQTITLPINTITINGSGIDSDGTISSYLWTKISGPSGETINNANSASAFVNNLLEGVYLFELKVTDSKGATATDTVTITVNPQKNILPNAEAGPDQTIMLPVSSIILTGSATDSNGQITKYLWEKISGPSDFNIENPNSAVTNVTGLTKGTYQFQLTVTDDKGATASSTIQIVVDQPSNIPPTASAGSDQTIRLPTNTLILSGNGTDADGTISSYSWIKISGPSGTILNNEDSASAIVNSLSEGVYQFEFTVTDDKGATGKDTVQVTVKPAVNISPTANAGGDKSITLPTDTVSLSGNGTDPDGTISSYSWIKISGSFGGTINNANSASATINNLSEGVYQFELTVTDDKNATGKDTVQVTVNAAPNMPPTANAGSDKIITLPSNTVSLSGNGTDPDGTISSYSWTKISGPSSATINNANSDSATMNNLSEGVYQFELAVTDDKGAVGKDTVQITVNAAANIRPTANSGGDKTITLPTNTVSLSGNGTDPDGTISSYFWSKISGPSNGTINNANSVSATINNLTEGVYQFELTVTDDKGAVGKDTVQVTVNPAANIPPTANAGADQTITLPTNSVSLSGNGTDPDGTIFSYAWTKISGPLAYIISSSSSAAIPVSGLVMGVYQFELKVTDDKGAIGKDTVQITVNTAANIPPTANAGADKTITLPTNSVSLSGSGTDSDGTIFSYAWTKIYGPSAYSISSSSSAATTVSGLVQGVYQFELKVTDDQGAVGKDTIQIRVNAASNVSLTADAGTNQTITLPTNTITLNGSGKDSDGTISSYFWSKISGPSSGTINNANSVSATINNLSEGVYQFELTVTDDKGAVGKDTVQVTVNAAANIPPTANAGADQTITLPTNSVSLSGSQTNSDGGNFTYSWTKIAGPSAYSVSNPSSAVTTVSGLVQGVYQIELKVTDDNGAIGKDTLKITVNAAQNIPPTADAGTNQTITLPINTITLNGSGKDSDGTIASYNWVKISGPSGGTINNPNSTSAIVNNLSEGIYQFELTVTDDKSATGKDTVQVTLNAAANISPTSNAGGDKTLTLPTDSVSLSGNGTDADGIISSYSWSKISGPAPFSIKNASSPTSEVSGLVEGVYLFELKVTDNNGATGSDTVRVTVNPAKNIPPVAQAGSDQTITLPNNTISLNGKGTDSDGTISTYLWTKIAGPAAGTISDASSASTTVKGLIPGNYIFQLTVMDNKGARGTDSIYVTVNAPKNMAPIANAGGDLTIVLPLNTVYLNGNGKDSGGTITAYQWKQIAGPDSASITTDKNASTQVKNLVGGTYEFELTVTDNDEATGSDTVSVVVTLGKISPEQNSINIYPNPVKDIATVEINTAEPTSNLSILISDFAGRNVYKKMTNSINYQAVERINMSNFSKGSYTISVIFDGADQQVFQILKL